MRLQNQSQLRGLRSDVRGPVRYFPQSDAGWPPFVTTAVFFDGTNDNQKRGANLTGATSGKEFTLAFMAKMDASKDGLANTFLTTSTTSSKFTSSRAATTNTLALQVQTSAAVNIRSSTATQLSLASADGWTWVGVSMNTATQTMLLYKNNTAQTYTGTITADAIIDFAGITDWGWAASTGNGNRAAACFCCIAFHTKFVDLSKTSVRRKFITASGLPVDISLSDPFGETPLIWCPTGDLTANDGTGGNFVTTGALTACADSPNPA